MKHLEWRRATGIGIAGLLVLGFPARATGSGSSTTESGSDTASSSGGTSGTGASASSGTSQEVSGTVQSYDRDSRELTLSHSDKKLKLNDDTKVTKDGQQASTSDIQEGDQVRASYSGAGDVLEVLVIEVIPAKTTPGDERGK